MNLDYIYKQNLNTMTHNQAYTETVRTFSEHYMRLDEWQKPEHRKRISDFVAKHSHTESVASGKCALPSYSLAV